MNNKAVKEMCKMRDDALIEATMKDNITPFFLYAKKYGVPMPNSARTRMGMIYKATYHCTSIPQKVRDAAKQKLLEMGFSTDI